MSPFNAAAAPSCTGYSRSTFLSKTLSLSHLLITLHNPPIPSLSILSLSTKIKKKIFHFICRRLELEEEKIKRRERETRNSKMEDPFPSSLSSSFLDQYATSGCTFAEMLEYSDAYGKSSSLGFMELLNMEQLGDSSALEEQSIHRPNQNYSKVQESSEVLNTPATPNYSSISSDSSDGLKDEQLVKEEDEEEEDEEDDEKKKTTKKQLKPKKTSQKKKREQRFAFMTKSEVDHLEDGYRWRKYGQKAVKNSPFPRSYYRCTNATCSVKKRVERSCTDPSIVVTTYEGQHTHPSPLTQRPPSAAAPPYAAAFPPSHNHHLMNNYSLLLNGYMGGGGGGAQQLSFCSQPPVSMADNGLLQDIVPWPMPKREEK